MASVRSGQRDLDLGQVRGGVKADWIGWPIAVLCQRVSAPIACRAAADWMSGAYHDNRQGGPAGEGGHHVVGALHDGRAGRQYLRHAQGFGVQADGRGGDGEQGKPADSAADSAGRASTRSRITFQSRLPSDGRRTRPRNGTRPRSTRSPSSDNSAGSTVTAATTAISTTKMVAIAKPANSVHGGQEHPGDRHDDGQPEYSTDRPEVAAAARSGRVLVPARGPLLAFAARVEQQ